MFKTILSSAKALWLHENSCRLARFVVHPQNLEESHHIVEKLRELEWDQSASSPAKLHDCVVIFCKETLQRDYIAEGFQNGKPNVCIVAESNTSQAQEILCEFGYCLVPTEIDSISVFVHVANVWMFWETTEPELQMPAWIEMCQQSAEKYCKAHKLFYLNKNTAKKLLSDLPWDKIEEFDIAHQADIIRVALVQRYGGFWFDADTLFVRDLPISLTKMFSTAGKSLLGVRNDRQDSNHILNGIFAGAPHSAVINEYMAAILAIVEQKSAKQVDWTEFGANLLTSLVEKHYQSVSVVAFERFFPVHWTKWQTFFSTSSFNTIVDSVEQNNSFTIGFYHALMGPTLNLWNKEKILQSDATVCSLLQHFLQTSQKEKSDSLAENMDRIYKNGIWNSNDANVPLSGPGSSLENTGNVRQFFDDAFQHLDIRRMADIGCGDLTWITKTKFWNLHKTEYVGMDVSSFVIEQNREKHPDVQFVHCNAAKDQFSDKVDTDIIVCRDMLMHLETPDAMKALQEISRCKSRWVMLTSANSAPEERKLNYYHFAYLCLTQKPFSFDQSRIRHVIDEPQFDRKVFIIEKSEFDDMVNQMVAKQINSANDGMFLLPIEGEQCAWASLKTNLYDDVANRKRGLCFMIRAKNEEENVQDCVNSIHTCLKDSKVDYKIVFVDNNSTDKTFDIAKSVLRSDTDVLLKYPLQVAKAGLETYVTPANSAHSLPWFYQYCLQCCDTYSHVFKWDADFRMTEALGRRLEKEFARDSQEEPAQAYYLHAVSEDEQDNTEPYILAASTKYHYKRYFLWECWHTDTPITKQTRFTKEEQIEHHSTLKQVKSYLEYAPWWERVDNSKLCDAIAKEYDSHAARFPSGTQLYCRASDPACEVLMRGLPVTEEKIKGL